MKQLLHISQNYLKQLLRESHNYLVEPCLICDKLRRPSTGLKISSNSFLRS